jgi:hypothetical protein
MTRDRHVSAFVGICTAIAFEAREADAQGGIACLPLNGSPSYSFEKVLDAAEATPAGMLTNDRGHALIQAQPAGTLSGSCLLRNIGSQTETVVIRSSSGNTPFCTRSINPTSPFTAISSPDWNERGAIVVNGTLHSSIPDFGISQIQVIETNGEVFALPTYDFYQGGQTVKSRPAITGQGDVFYLNAAGDLQRFVPTLPGDDKSETIVSGATLAIIGVEPAVEGKLYFNAGGKRVGTVQNALGPVSPPWPGNPLAPYPTTFVVDDASSSVPTPNRFGAFVYFAATEIRRRLDVGGVDFVAGDPEFIIETTGSPDVPISSILATTLAGPCKVALLGRARGVCRDGPSDGLICDTDDFPDPCPDGLGGPIDGYCEHDVQGVYVHQAGSYAAVARVGDPMLGSTAAVFYPFGGPELFVGSTAGPIFFTVRLADGRNLLVRAEPGGGSTNPYLPTSSAGTSSLFNMKPTGWLGSGPNGVPLFFDPDVATGYDYTLDAGDPLFASVMVPAPLPNGDASFTLIVGEESFPLEAGEQFDLTQVDSLGVAAFSIRGIDPGEELDPEDPMAFVTGATFMEEREANVTMTAVVPEPGAAAAGVAVLLALRSLVRHRRLQSRPSTSR